MLYKLIADFTTKDVKFFIDDEVEYEEEDHSYWLLPEDDHISKELLNITILRYDCGEAYMFVDVDTISNAFEYMPKFKKGLVAEMAKYREKMFGWFREFERDYTNIMVKINETK